MAAFYRVVCSLAYRRDLLRGRTIAVWQEIRVKHAFEQFAAWRLELPPPRPELGPRAQDEQARQRWDGEGGNPGTPPLRRKRDRANLLARNRRATSLESKETAWKRTAVTRKG